MNAVAGHTANQRRVLAELGLLPLRRRQPPPDTGVATPDLGMECITLTGAAADDALLAALLALMRTEYVSRQAAGLCLDLPATGDGLPAQLALQELRRRPDWKRGLWERQRRLRRQVGG